MDLIWQGLQEALRLVITRDDLVLDAAWRSVWISTFAVTLAAGIGLPLGTLLARQRFPGRRMVVIVARASMAVPTVFVGIICYALFSRRGMLGPAELLYTPWAIVAGELLLAAPIITSITHGSIRALDPRVSETAQTLGAGPFQRWLTYLSEARMGIVLALLTAFARCVTELGVAMMVGGNIKDRTRTLATATALETGRGEFGRGLAMGFILLIIALGISASMVWLGRDEQDQS